eukprot:CAMPEP_0168479428 /NCGR_PEP_ID=MMETSP0228-20121227/63467_1 /TAXON_ID=133427 /ORGANISM="Protoceratium reticulatum, Strain CCCM 535 (=CCMP 1889)" /LENGTH=84 /DNA_ID=CAMNT_0008495717 /DNA_START=27 /DNA_END=277 /DNA_ORIENTATION=+
MEPVAASACAVRDDRQDLHELRGGCAALVLGGLRLSWSGTTSTTLVLGRSCQCQCLVDDRPDFLAVLLEEGRGRRRGRWPAHIT